MREEPENAQSGFTLIEIVVVLAIAAVAFSIGAVGLAALKGRDTPLRSAKDVAQLMNATHIAAINGIPQRVTIDLKTKQLSSQNGRRMVMIPGEYAVSVVIGRETVVDTQVLEVHFLPDGTSSGAEIMITGPGGGQARVDVNWLTGLARVSDASS